MVTKKRNKAQQVSDKTGFTIMERIPTQLILHPQPGLLGASYCALELM